MIMSYQLPTLATRRMRALVLAMAVLGVVTLAGAENPFTPQQLTTQLEQIRSNDVAYKAAVRGGAERVAFCSYCHGKDGNSVKPEVPKLAGQNAKYLFNQFERFAEGERKNFVMQELADQLSAQDRINIAIYYSSLPVSVEPVDATLASNGKIIYDTLCHVCHGPDGHGKDEYPRLAGQKPDYVALTLRAFRDAASKHSDPTMLQVATTLSDDNVDAISAYVGTLP
ncbi:MAG: cytochrome biogenesis protein ResB [Gammaproteobacteria bacterium HGW-Gammaproteobacteria-2]|nr:MAG: cytochrome biogenesis protein ResB [Gammaproteobacteria bacterium HGW-Gammaproteobacteria-2]